MSGAEAKLEAYLVNRVLAIGGEAPKWSSPGQRGVPDRIVFGPKGAVVFVEMKAGTRRPSPQQEAWHHRLRELGQDVRLIDNRDAIDDLIQEISNGHSTSHR